VDRPQTLTATTATATIPDQEVPPAVTVAVTAFAIPLMHDLFLSFLYFLQLLVYTGKVHSR